MAKLAKRILRERPFFWAIPAVVWQALFLCVPFAVVIGASFIRDFDVAWSGFTLSHYVALFKPVYGYILFRSLGLALLTGVSCVLIGYPVAYYLAFYVKRWKNLLLFFLILPFWTNFLVQVYAWFFILEKEGILNSVLSSIGLISEPIMLLNSMTAIGIVMIYCYVPFMILPIYTVLEKMDKTVIEASQDLGATATQTWARVVLPLSMPGIVTGFFLVFVPAFGEYVIPLLMGGDKYFFVGGLVTNYVLGARNWPMGAAFTCLSSLVLLMVLLISNRMLARRMRLLQGE